MFGPRPAHRISTHFQHRILRISSALATLALVGCMATAPVLLSGHAAFAATQAAEDQTSIFDEVAGNTAASSFLAAQFANAEHDYALAAELLEDALSFEPEEEPLQQSLMAVLLQAGEFERATEIAERFMRAPDTGRLARQIMFVDDMKARRYTAALGTLNIEKP
ncbi:MAG: hypothetical protein AAGH82_07970, partial [Pseudomonadota bacterium]